MPNYYPAAAEVLEPLRRLQKKRARDGQARRPRGRAALSRLRRLRVAQAPAPSFHRRPGRGAFSRASSPLGRAKSSATSAATAPSLPPTSPSSCANRGSSGSLSQASRPMSVSAPPSRTLSPTASGSRAERGDQLQPAASRGGIARGHRTLFRRRRVARRGARDASMRVVVMGYASLDYVVRLDRRRGQTEPRRSFRGRPNGRGSAAPRPMSRRRWSPAALATQRQ